MKRYVPVAVVLLFAALSCSAAMDKSEGKASNAFKTKAKTVVIFKDGYGFFLREGRASLIDHWCMTDYIPQAVAGTFWLYSPDPGMAVTTVRSTGRNQVPFETPDELGERLTNYIGLQVSVTTEDGTFEGELLRVVDDMILLKSDKQVTVVELADVKSAQILGEPLLVKVEGGKPNADATVAMGYLQQGINWTASYTLDLIGDSRGKITLRATITNGVEDLNGATIYLVVGVPNFSMKGQLDPLTVHALGTAVLPRVAADSSKTQVLEYGRGARDGDRPVSVPELNVPMEGLQSLYFYEKKGLDMLAGDVVMATMMEGTVPYRSLFVWDVDAGSDVVQCIVLKNELGSPLTTGPVLVVQRGKPVSQDLLKYMPSGAEGRLKLTTAADIRTKRTEREIERDKVDMIDNITYIATVNEGELVLENHRKEAADVEVTWNVSGKILDVSDDAIVQSEVNVEQGLNPANAIKATVKIDPGEKHTLTYKYVRYVRARA